MPRSQDLNTAARAAALGVVGDALTQATAAAKCHGCGCMLHTIGALEQAAHLAPELTPVLAGARRVLTPKKYDCLGCETCLGVIADRYPLGSGTTIFESSLFPHSPQEAT